MGTPSLPYNVKTMLKSLALSIFLLILVDSSPLHKKVYLGECPSHECVENGHFPEGDCSPYFCQCEHGMEHLMLCPQGLFFNPVPSVCDWDWNIPNCQNPTQEPTEKPTDEPTDEPTEEPTDAPTDEPTEDPTDPPTEEPTKEPTKEPTNPPTAEPTEEPTEEPTIAPTDDPTEEPTEEPTNPPTDVPTAKPTNPPTEEPTEEPTEAPTEPPTDEPADMIEVSISGDNEFQLYSGAPDSPQLTLLGSGNDWRKTVTLSAPSSGALTIVVTDKGSVGGLLLSTSDGRISDSSWSCQLEGQQQWEGAQEVGTNGVKPWSTRPGINPEANWIWVTPDGNPPPGVSFPYTVTCYKEF